MTLVLRIRKTVKISRIHNKEREPRQHAITAHSKIGWGRKEIRVTYQTSLWKQMAQSGPGNITKRKTLRTTLDNNMCRVMTAYILNGHWTEEVS